MQVAIAYLVDLVCALLVLGVAYWLRPSFVLLAVVAVELLVVDALARSVVGRTLGHWVSGTRLVADTSLNTRPALSSSALYSLVMALLHVTVVGPLIIQLTASQGQSALHRLAKTRVMQPAREHAAASAIPSGPYRKSSGGEAPSPSPAPSFDGGSAWQPQSDFSGLYPAAPASAQEPGMFTNASTALAMPEAPAAPAMSVAPDVFTPQHDASLPVAADVAYLSAPEGGSFILACDDGSVAPIGDCLVVGASPDLVYPGSNTLTLADDSGMIAAAHIMLTVADGQLSLLDMGSQAGATALFPDGTLMHIPSGYELALVPGCQIQLSTRLVTVALA